MKRYLFSFFDYDRKVSECSFSFLNVSLLSSWVPSRCHQPKAIVASISDNQWTC